MRREEDEEGEDIEADPADIVKLLRFQPGRAPRSMSFDRRTVEFSPLRHLNTKKTPQSSTFGSH